MLLHLLLIGSMAKTSTETKSKFHSLNATIHGSKKVALEVVAAEVVSEVNFEKEKLSNNKFNLILSRRKSWKFWRWR